MSAITPWGRAQQKKIIAPGITRYDTAGHGGYYVSKAVRAVMPRHCVNKDGWYEEDCEWCKVVIAFPHLFTEAILPIAKRVYEQWFDRYGNYKREEYKPCQDQQKTEQ